MRKSHETGELPHRVSCGEKTALIGDEWVYLWRVSVVAVDDTDYWSPLVELAAGGERTFEDPDDAEEFARRVTTRQPLGCQVQPEGRGEGGGGVMTITETTLTIVCPTGARSIPSSMRPTCGTAAVTAFTTLPRSRLLTRAADRVSTLSDPKPGRPVEVHWTSQSAPNGTESASPMFWIDDREYSVDQALDLCEAVANAVATYRCAGGVA
jgi:hypothetical protein